MISFTKKELTELIEIHNDICISIYLPTHRSGDAVLQQEDALILKNQLRIIRRKLQRLKLTRESAEQILSPALMLLEDRQFWNHQLDGLVIFLSHNFSRVYKIPARMELFNFISKEFYLAPLVPLITNTERFFLLSLSLQKTILYEVNPYEIHTVHVDPKIPDRPEEIIGYDYRQKNLQFRSRIKGRGQAIYHGHGEGKDERKDEVLKFFRAIDQSILPTLNKKHLPLVAAGLDYLLPIYKEANSYQYLSDKFISCHPSDMTEQELHQRSVATMQPYFDREKKNQLDLYRQLDGTGKTSTDIQDILPDAAAGTIDTLFIEKFPDTENFEAKNANRRKSYKDKTTPDFLLMNLAVLQIFLHGGKVYLMEKDQMPNPGNWVSAMYRY